MGRFSLVRDEPENKDGWLGTHWALAIIIVIASVAAVWIWIVMQPDPPKIVASPPTTVEEFDYLVHSDNHVFDMRRNLRQVRVDYDRNGHFREFNLSYSRILLAYVGMRLTDPPAAYEAQHQAWVDYLEPCLEFPNQPTLLGLNSCSSRADLILKQLRQITPEYFHMGSN